MMHKTISGSSQVIAQYYQLIRLGFEVNYFSSSLSTSFRNLQLWEIGK